MKADAMTQHARRYYVDVDSWQIAKRGQFVAGDVFLCQKIKEEDRTLAVLSDGLGSGIKASVLATLTATMALKYTAGFMDIKKSAETIMDTLPICSVRKISYSTFTILDMEGSGHARLIEYDNPPCLLIRNGAVTALDRTPIALAKWHDRTLSYSELQACPGDRIVFFTDGVSQAGMGEYHTPLGWGIAKAGDYVAQTIQADPGISAHSLAKELATRAQALDGGEAKDDITCGVIHFREPRRMLIATGPPFFQSRDRDLARIVESFRGTIAICGGTTANIISRILERHVRMRLDDVDPEIPPPAYMDGVNLVTEGTLTLGRVASLLESGAAPETARQNAATELVTYLLESDIIQIVVGTRINQAHQDPNVPMELDIRRNIVKKIVGLLESKYMKEVQVQHM
ncbi:MAG TPA: SpoIIE family protein phosphatase [Bryobacteraceae bacterium]|nr:SpoIIE family protein phosphatase [Bryobacteraceae bacterium]